MPLVLAQRVEVVTPDTSPRVNWVGSGHEATQWGVVDGSELLIVKRYTAVYQWFDGVVA